MVVIAYILFGIAVLVVGGLLITGISYGLSNFKDASKEQKKEKLKNFLFALVFFGSIILFYFGLEWGKSLFPEKPTIKETVMKRFPWVEDDMPDDYYQGIYDAMYYDD